MDLKKFIPFHEALSHFNRTLSIKVVGDTEETIGIEVQIKEEHLSSPGTAHGGAIAGLMDAILGVKTLAYAVMRDQLCSTVEFKINFLRPVLLGDMIFGEAEILQKGKTLVVTSATLYRMNAQGEKEAVAHGLGTFNLYPMEKKFI
jgi:uncharacterized protein (TIGR00369 family)